MRFFQGPLDTPLDSPLSATLSVHVLHFTVCTPSSFTLKSSTFVGISVDTVIYAPMCMFVSTFVREFVGQISRFACSVLF